MDIRKSEAWTILQAYIDINRERLHGIKAYDVDEYESCKTIEKIDKFMKPYEDEVDKFIEDNKIDRNWTMPNGKTIRMCKRLVIGEYLNNKKKMEEKKFTKEEIELAYCKDHAWEILTAYINMKLEKDGEYPEFRDSWIREFTNLDNVDEINHFIKYFEDEFEKYFFVSNKGFR